MGITLKITGKPTAEAQRALDPHITTLYDRPGARAVAVVELTHVERLQPAPGSDKSPAVGMKITACEVPTRDQEGVIREVMRALYLQRTAHGTLDESGQLELSQDTLKDAAGLLMSYEVARLRAGLAHWTEYARKVANASTKLAVTEMAHELTSVADGLDAVLAAAAPADED